MAAPIQESPSRSPFRDDHEQFRAQVRRFVEREIRPFHAGWEEEGIVPTSLWRKAGSEGLLNCMLPQPYGQSGDFGHSAVVIEELARINASAPGFSVHSEIVSPYLLAYGSEEQKRRWLPDMALGKLIGAIAMTEPGAGSDVKAIRTTARREGDYFVLNGQKTFISNGHHAGIVIVVAKTDAERGAKGISLICVEGDTPGFSRGKRLKKIGLRGQDTAELYFDNALVPAANLLGEENRGFAYLMHELAQERLIIATRAAASIEAFLERTIEYTRARKAFGQSLFDYQNTRFKLAEATAQLTMLRTFVDDCLARHLRGELSAERAAMAKLTGSEMQNRLLDEFLQLHGGYGFMSEYEIGGAWIDARVGRIYGGSNEIMKEIVARGL